MAGETNLITHVGQTLWCVTERDRRYGTDAGVEVRVTKVGRKWATVAQFHDDRPINPSDIGVDGGWKPNDDYYLSRQHYRDHVEAERLWHAIREAASGYQRPPVSLADLRGVLAILTTKS